MNGDRYYTIKTEQGVIRLPSVTTLLKIINRPGLNIWRAKQGFEASEQYAQETSNIGKEIHGFVAQISKGLPIPPLQWDLLSEEIKNGCRAYVRWQRQYEFQPIANELLVYSLKYSYAGTLDAIGWINIKGKRNLIIADWKTGERIWQEYVLQVAAYAVALKERDKTFNNQLKEAHIVSLNRNTGIPHETIVDKSELKEAFKAFCHAKALWEYYDNHR